MTEWYSEPFERPERDRANRKGGLWRALEEFEKAALEDNLAEPHESPSQPVAFQTDAWLVSEDVARIPSRPELATLSIRWRCASDGVHADRALSCCSGSLRADGRCGRDDCRV